MGRQILGIDPGKKGGIALLDPEAQTVLTWPMPDTTTALHALIAGLPLIKTCALEKPFYPKMIGMANAARIAEAYGILKGALAWRDISFREVRPVDWKKRLGVPADKAGARRIASEMFPDSAEEWKLAKHDGRAEAALIAVYAQGWRA